MAPTPEPCQVCAALLEFLEAMAMASHPHRGDTARSGSTLADAFNDANSEGRVTAFRLAAAELRQHGVNLQLEQNQEPAK